MPEYATTQRLSGFENDFGTKLSADQFVPPLARLLAEFHTSLNVVGLRYFDGNMDRFLVFCLLLRTSLSHPERNGTISVHSAAMSLGRPFETVRRHICSLLDRGVCERTPTGVKLSRPYWATLANWRQMRYAHDCFVRLVADGLAAGVIPGGNAPESAKPPLSLNDGICAAVDLLLALTDANRNLCSESIDLAIFSAILHANQQHAGADRLHPGLPVPVQPRHAVRVAQIARALSLPDTTVRRRVTGFCGAGGIYIRTPGGLLVAPDHFQACRGSVDVGGAKHGSIRLIIQRAVTAGLSLRHPTRSYSEGRPETPRIG